MEPFFTITYVVLGVALLIVELLGVRNSKRSGDTISEHIWWAQKKWPVLRYLVGAFTIWLFIHFFWFGTVA